MSVDAVHLKRKRLNLVWFDMRSFHKNLADKFLQDSNIPRTWETLLKTKLFIFLLFISGFRYCSLSVRFAINVHFGFLPVS